jgi:hypothetical protein
MNVSELRADLQGSRERLFAAIRGLSEEQFRHAPAGDAWPIAAHLAHLLRLERLYVGWARRALDDAEPRIESTGVTNDDDAGLAQRLAVPQIVHGMLNARRDLDALLADCDDAALARPLTHARLGRWTVGSVARKAVQHEDEHAAAVVSIVKGLPPSGRVILPLVPRS